MQGKDSPVCIRPCCRLGSCATLGRQSLYRPINSSGAGGSLVLMNIQVNLRCLVQVENSDPGSNASAGSRMHSSRTRRVYKTHHTNIYSLQNLISIKCRQAYLLPEGPKSRLVSLALIRTVVRLPATQRYLVNNTKIKCRKSLCLCLSVVKPSKFRCNSCWRRLRGTSQVAVITSTKLFPLCCEVRYIHRSVHDAPAPQ